MAKNASKVGTANPEAIFRSACNQLVAVRVLQNRFNVNDEISDSLGAALIANSALAAEQLFKCIQASQQDGRFTMTHDLQALFRSLDGNSQTAIERCYSELDAAHCVLARPMEWLPKGSESVLECDLAFLKDAFEAWRYQFEDKKRFCWGLSELCDTLHSYVLLMHPEWDSNEDRREDQE
jgi:hypothetical protein